LSIQLHPIIKMSLTPLAAIVDLGTRRIVGWAMSERMSAKLVCDVLQMAYWRRRPAPELLMHSDRGSQYASEDYRKLIKQFHMTQSMSRKGNCWDNAPSGELLQDAQSRTHVPTAVHLA
jgi:transposase InsO family protein